MANQRLVGKVDHTFLAGIAPDLDKTHLGGGKRVDDRHELLPRPARPLRHAAEPQRPAHVLPAAFAQAAAGDGPKQRFRQRLLGRTQAGQYRVRMLVQRLLHAADGSVRRPVDQRAISRCGDLPHAGQGVLQDGQLVGVLADAVDQFGHQFGLDVTAEHARRPGDGAFHLNAGQPRREVLGPIDGFRQLLKAHAVAEKVGAHRQRHIHARAGIVPCGQQQIHEGLGLVGLRTAGLGIGEDLFELVDQHQQIERLGALHHALACTLHHMEQGKWATAKFRLHGGDFGGGVLPVLRNACLAHQFAPQGLAAQQGLGQAAHGPVTGAKQGNAPVAAGSEAAHGQPRQQAGAHQARLARARRADDGQEPLALQDFEQAVGMFFPAEENLALMCLEGPQTGIRPLGLAELKHARRPAAR